MYNAIIVNYLLILISIQSSHCLIPTVCIRNASSSGVCCPAPKYSTQTCGGPTRGYCKSIDIPHEIIPEIYTFDDRVEWPKRFYHKLCHCHGNFYGLSCDQCWFGWEGPNCDKKVVQVRRNMKSLNNRDRNILKHVVDRSLYVKSDYSVYIDKDSARHDPIMKPIKWLPASIQYVMTFMHKFGSRPTMFEDYLDCQNFGILNFNHDGVGFPTWHRMYMLYWERELQGIAKKEFGVHDFRLPYWDWVNLKECDICTNDFVGAQGNEDQYGVRISRGSPYWNWTEFCSEPNDALENPCYGCHITGKNGKLTRAWNSYDFPTTADVNYIFSKRRFHSSEERPDDLKCKTFRRALEGTCGQSSNANNLFWMHNKVHNMIDGSMCCVGTAPNDPIFIYHHVMVDRMFEAYLNRYKVPIEDYPKLNARPGHGREAYMIGFIPVVRNSKMFVPSHMLGYTYDHFDFGKGNSENRDLNNPQNENLYMDKEFSDFLHDVDNY